MTHEWKTSRRTIVPRGLSDHGLPKSPGVSSPNGSLRSYRFGGSTPPLSPRSFISLFKAEDSPQSLLSFSPTATFKDHSPFGSPQFPPVPEFHTVLKDADIDKPCLSCSKCKQKSSTITLDSDKENISLDETNSTHKSFSRLAHRIKAALATRHKEDSAEQSKPSRSKRREVQKVEPTHWTEM